jgi:Asp-tRNA(Asn)/Glu-tRNA(Gln) amidotransferase A subunit family amidase
MTEPFRLTAKQAAQQIADGTLTSETLVASCLERIKAREPEVGAWFYLDPELALAQARALDQGPRRGKLHGVPVGVKDIIETMDMPTGYGSGIYTGNRTAWDAPSVALIRQAGAVAMGKTVTSEYAGYHPGKTVNPHNKTRAPGISSSGSAAAVADYMVPLAFGSQTGASIIKPAAFCGSVGYKPTYGTFVLGGVHPLAGSLDTLGYFARDVDDLALFGEVLGNRPGFGAGAFDRAPRIGLCRTAMWDKMAAPEVKKAVENAAANLARAGAQVTDVTLPAECDKLNAACITVIRYEAARVMAHEYRTKRDGLSKAMQGVVEDGNKIPYADYRAALDLAAHCRRLIAPVFKVHDALLTPSAECEAAPIENPIGDSVFSRLWTILHVPCTAMTTELSAGLRLPVGIQLVGMLNEDEKLLRVSRWVEERVKLK